MADAPDTLALTGWSSKGGLNNNRPPPVHNAEIWVGVKWEENETDPCFYRVEAHRISTSDWEFVKDVLKGVSVANVRVGTHNVSNGLKTKLYDTIRVTCIGLPTDVSPGSATIAVPTIPANSHVAADNFVAVCRGKITDTLGTIEVSWDDDSVEVSSGYVSIRRVSDDKVIANSWLYIGAAQPGNQVLTPGAKAAFGDGGGFGIDGRGFATFPVDISPSRPLPLHDGDLISFQVVSDIFAIANVGKVTAFSFVFYREITIVPFTESATRTVAFSKQVEIVTDSYTPVSPATFSASGLPAGLSINSSGVISGTPTAEGTFSVIITATNLVGQSTATCTIVVNPPAVPVINSPGTTQTLRTLIPASLSLKATNSPSSFAIVSGSLPTGLSLNTSTGAISGTPTVVASASNVVFKATNAVGDSSNYTISFTVLALTTPVINSGSSLTVYPGEAASYTISTDVAATDYSVTGLPAGFRRQGPQVLGTVSSTVTVGVYPVSIHAINQAGIGPQFILSITVAVRPPVISSALSTSGYIGSSFHYQIGATHSPTSYAATALPDGLELGETGLISGTPTTPGTYDVNITVANAGGSDTKTLKITLTVPPRPVIDTGITSGKTVTAKANVPFVFQPSASNSPSSWSADPIPDGMALNTANGKVSGAFNVPGLYAISFVASNAGGDSDPSTFYFLVAEGPPTAVQANSTGIDIWINLHSGQVSISDPASPNNTVTVKRGDTSEFNIRFHKDGVPIDIVPSTLKAAAKINLDEEYVVYVAAFEKIGVGAFRMLPDFSENNTELESDLNQDSLDLIAEVQWETAEPAVRRSSNTFKLTVLRDVIHPD